MENKHSAAAALSSIDGEDVTTWALPEGAIARLGTGSCSGVWHFHPTGSPLQSAQRLDSGYTNSRR